MFISGFFFFCFLVLFLLGFFGVFFVRRNLLIVLMSIELMLLSVNLIFILYSCLTDDLLGQIFVFFIITVAAAESAIGLSLLIVYFRLNSVISVDQLSNIKG